jgi:hypothetical protein
MPKSAHITTDLEKSLATIREQAFTVITEQQRIIKESSAALRKVRLARGTERDLDQAAAAAQQASTADKLADYKERVSSTLRGSLRPMTMNDLVKRTGMKAPMIALTLRHLRSHVHHLDDGRWIWVIGDSSSPEELRAQMTRLLTLEPWSFRDLLAMTGCRRGRVSGIIVDWQRTGAPIDYIGDDRKGKWFLKSTNARTKRAG